MNILSDLSQHEKVIYLAGLMEGEGCFTTSKGKPEVTLSMTDRDVVEWVAENFPSGGKVRTVPPFKENWSVKYTFRWCGRHAAPIMQSVYPYMGVRRQARIAELLATLDKPLGMCYNGSVESINERSTDGVLGF